MKNELVKITGGKFMMGSPEGEEGRWRDEGPLHEVHVPDFYIGRYPVTNEEYGIFLNDNSGVKEPKYWGDRRYNGSNQPVVGVSWDDAQLYAEWADLRLPSEAEWEYACRAGSTTRFYTGNSKDDLDRAGWYNENSGDKLYSVGKKEPNIFGLYDMHGNVWEWVEDHWHGDYKNAPIDGKSWCNREGGGYRVVRGGGWVFNAGFCRSAIRIGGPPDDRGGHVGFRLSRSVTLGS